MQDSQSPKATTTTTKPIKRPSGLKNIAGPSHEYGEKIANGIAQSSSKETGSTSPKSPTTEDSDRSDSGSNGDNIHVVVRVRPLSVPEKQRKDQDIVNVPDEGAAIWIDNNIGQSKPFTFNRVLPHNASQEKVFEECGIKHLIDMALEGYSCTVLAFGQTGSGKTYTLTGPVNLGSNWDENGNALQISADSFGLMQRSFRYLIKQMRSKQASFTLKASYLEVYNERVQDLLELSSSRDSLVVRWSADRGFYVEDLFCVTCENEDDLMAVLEEGLQNRQVRAHCINDHSSRSHCMLTLNLDIETSEADEDGDFVIMKYGKLCFVDLAGNERVKETKSSGELFTESQNINKSLLTLGNCISALSDAKKRNGHIPYRDSKLTKLLAKSIGGDGMTLMIACISPSSYAVSDTLNTLRYAQRAKKIKNKPVVQMDPKEKLILSLKREIKLLRKENSYFKNQFGVSSSRPTSASVSSVEPWTDDGGESLRETPLSTDTDEERTPTPWQAMSVERSASLPPGLYDMLQEYMVENENLRTENGDLYTSRDTMRRQNIVISRENEMLVKKLEQLESRSSSAVSSSSRLPSGLGRMRSLTDDPKLLTSPGTSPLPSNNSVSDSDKATSSESKDVGNATTPSSVVCLPPVRKTRSNPTTSPEKAPKPAGQSRPQPTLLNIQKDVEWLAKHQSRQNSNAETKSSTFSQDKVNNDVEEGNPNEQTNGPNRSVRMSKIPQRAKEPSSYAKIFAKHKANQPRRDETADEPQASDSATHEENSESRGDGEGSHGISRIQPGTSRIPHYAANHFKGYPSDPNQKLREDLDLLANQIDYYRHSYPDSNNRTLNRPR
ncbi:LOW QUALITY PROTEIN: kinesin-like protein KIF12 [Dendronephthya gigantea]|uniref:LOW QUALITY PROTEIN: kinesin-like protein KIF12 n=1 Tax=Dendronephthya gigantea TaxID=151771 RepID=UPI00106CB53E|nr:LOW QUALITY PROTEIN: kinesin-like protein KIF12 [Dendronephthya gigantea]